VSHKIAYIYDWRYGVRSGVSQKVLDQIEAWNRNGIQTTLFIACPREDANSWKALGLDIQVFPYQRIVSRYFARMRIVRKVCEENFDFTYVRFGVFPPDMIFLLKKMKVILELNFKGLYEYSRRSIFLYIYMAISRRLCFLRCTGAVAVTNEILNEFRLIRSSSQDSCFIPNGINLDKYISHSRIKSPKLTMVFVGSPNLVWHGLDRILDLAKNLPNVDFYIVGAFKQRDHENVYFVGELTDEALVKMTSSMDIGISSLAMDRNHLQEGTPLKTRLYLACGLPVIGGYVDPGLEPDADYFLRIDPEEWSSVSSVAMKVENFGRKWKGKTISSDKLTLISTNVSATKFSFFLDGLKKINF